MTTPVSGQIAVPMHDVAAKESSGCCCLGNSICQVARNIAFPLLAGTIVFSGAGALWGYFGTSLVVPYNVYTVAVGTFNVFGIAYTTWMYKKNLPQKDLENDIGMEKKENDQLADIEKGEDQTLGDFERVGGEVNQNLVGLQDKINDLQKQFDSKTKRLAKITNKLKALIDEQAQTKLDLAKANKIIEDSKALVISMGKTSEAMITSIKTVGVAENRLKNEDDRLDQEEDRLDAENKDLKGLVEHYSETVDKAHKQLQSLLSNYQKLLNVVEQMQHENSELKDIVDRLKEGASDMNKDVNSLTSLVDILKKFNTASAATKQLEDELNKK